MSFDSISEESNAAADNGVANGHRKPNEPEASPGSSGRHSRNKSREKTSPSRHRGKSDSRSAKKKKREKGRSPSPKRRSRSRDRSRRERDRRDDKWDSERRRDGDRKRDKKNSSSRRDRNDRSPQQSSSRKRGKTSRRRRSTSTESSGSDLQSLKHSSTLFGLFGNKKEDVKGPKSKRRKQSSSSSSSSEDTRDSKISAMPTTSTAVDPAVVAAYATLFQQNPQLGFAVQPQPPPTQLGAMPFPPPPPPPVLPPPPMFNSAVPPPLPPPQPVIGLNPSSMPPLPPVPPPPVPPQGPPPSTSKQRIPLPRTRRFDQPLVLNKEVRDIDYSGDWGSGFVDDKYEMMNQVGEGTYGQVYKGKDRIRGHQVALKKVRLDNEKEGFPITAVREIKILRQLNHGNIVKLWDVVADQRHANDLRSTVTNFFLVFEYVDHDLTGLLSAMNDRTIPEFKPDQVASLFKQLIQGLEYCHGKNFLHRDIKCSNILVNNRGELKIADWGLARLYVQDQQRPYTNRVITLWYRPPELLLGQEHYGPAIDVWSAGCILAEFFTKKAIFCGQHEAHQLDIISKECGTPTPEVWPDVVDLPQYKTLQPKSIYFRRLKETYNTIMPEGALDLMDKMLILDPKNRISCESALRHRWVKDIDPKRVQPLQLPVNQDCHELWSKQQRNKRKSGIPAVPLPTSSALPGIPGHLVRESSSGPHSAPHSRHSSQPPQPASNASNGDVAAVAAFNAAWDRFIQDPGAHTKNNLQRTLDILSDEMAREVFNRLSNFRKNVSIPQASTWKEKLIMFAESVIGSRPPVRPHGMPPHGGPPPQMHHGPPPGYHRPPPGPPHHHHGGHGHHRGPPPPHHAPYRASYNR